MFIRYHDTDVVHYHKNGITLNSGGYRTVTTKKRINTFFEEHNMTCRIVQEKCLWYIYGHLFYDGMILNNNGILKVADISVNRLATRYKKQINKYMIKLQKYYDDNNHYPYPSGGDCWLCMANLSTDCVLEHLKECYVHGTLIKNALLSAGYTNPDYVFNMEWIVKRAVRKYLKKCTGLLA